MLTNHRRGGRRSSPRERLGTQHLSATIRRLREWKLWFRNVGQRIEIHRRSDNQPWSRFGQSICTWSLSAHYDTQAGRQSVNHQPLSSIARWPIDNAVPPLPATVLVVDIPVFMWPKKGDEWPHYITPTDTVASVLLSLNSASAHIEAQRVRHTIIISICT